MFQLSTDVSLGEANVFVLVHPLLFFGVRMCRSFFLFVCHGYEVILVPAASPSSVLDEGFDGYQKTK